MNLILFWDFSLKIHKSKPNLEMLTKSYLLVISAGIFDPYIPPEGDARLSSLSKEGLKQRTEQIRQSAASQLA